MAKNLDAPEHSVLDRRGRVEALDHKVHTLQRSVLDKSVLQGLLPVRARQVAHRSAQPEARARLQRFSAASPSYVQAVADDDPLGGSARVIDLDSLTWWVPLTRPDDEALVQRALGHQDFPYRVLTQTRELALGGQMIDIGANTGRMSVPRVVLGDVTAAYCAEPDALNFACLARNVRDNHLEGLVLPDRVAISSSNGSVRLMRSRTSGGHRVLDADATTRHDVVEVEALTLDSWVERAGIDLQQVVFVKLDAQGSEVHVLMGAERVLACRHIAWQIEVDLPLLGRRGFTAGDLYRHLHPHFTHFIDLDRSARGPRVRPMSEMSDALSAVGGGSGGRTDILVFTLEAQAAR